MFLDTETPDQHQMKHINQYSDSDNRSIRSKQSINARNNRIEKIGRNGDLSTNLKMEQGCVYFQEKYDPNCYIREEGRLKPRPELMKKYQKITKTSDPTRKSSQQNNISKTRG